MSDTISIERTGWETFEIKGQDSTTTIEQSINEIHIESAGIQGPQGAGVDPTEQELAIIDHATLKSAYTVTTRHPSGQRNLCTYTDHDGYTNITVTYGVNVSSQFTTVRKQFDYDGQTWVYEIENLWTVDGHNGVQINEFSRT